MIILKKDLNFYKKHWNSDKHLYENIKIEYIDYLFTEFREYIEIEEGFTLRHYFEMMKKYPELQIIDSFFPDYIKEYENTCCVPNFKMEQGEVDYLTLSKYTSREKGYRKKLHNIEESIHFSGWGFCDDDYCKGFISYAIEYSPLKNLIDLEIRLHHHIISIEKENKRYEYDEYDSGEPHITVFEFLKEIIWELSWCGIPTQRDEKRDYLDSTYDKLKEELKEI